MRVSCFVVKWVTNPSLQSSELVQTGLRITTSQVFQVWLKTTVVIAHGFFFPAAQKCRTTGSQKQHTLDTSVSVCFVQEVVRVFKV